MSDVEDTSDLTHAPDLVDDLAQRVGELSLTVPTQEDLLELRLAIARVGTELARLTTDLHAGVDRLDARVEALEDDLTAEQDDRSSSGRSVLRQA